MFPFCQEVQEFLSGCAAVQSLFARGASLTPDERDLVEFYALDILERVKQN